MDSVKTQDIAATRTSQCVAPEDLRVGDYVGVLQASVQYPTYLWHGDLTGFESDECVRVAYMPNDGGVPLKVLSISLPFILVKAPAQRPETMDVRQCKLARLDSDYARTAWRAIGKPIKRMRRQSKKKSK